jgi:peptidoglycan hydrolase-like protein with peptidoglycan-binding domain
MTKLTQAPNNSVDPQIEVSAPSLNSEAGPEVLSDIRNQALTRHPITPSPQANDEEMLVAQLSLSTARESLEDAIRTARDTIKSWGPGIIVNLSGTQINILGNGEVGPLPSGEQSGDGFDADAIRLTSNLGASVRVNGYAVATDKDYCIKIPNFSNAVLIRASDGIVDISFNGSPASGDWSIEFVSSIVGRNPSWNPDMPTTPVDQANREILMMMYGEQPSTDLYPVSYNSSYSSDQDLTYLPYARKLDHGYQQLQDLRDGRNNQGQFNQGHRGYGVVAIKSEIYAWAVSSGNPYAQQFDMHSDFFGEAERIAVESFQEHIGLPVDGIVGPETAEALLWMRQQRSLGRI